MNEANRKAYGAALVAIGERVAVTLAKNSAIREGSLVLPKTALMEGLVEAYELGCEAGARQEGNIAEMAERIKALEAKAKPQGVALMEEFILKPVVVVDEPPPDAPE